MTIAIILTVVFFVLAIVAIMVACLRMANEEDEWMIRQMEEKSIENADVFVHDVEPTILGVDLAKEEEDENGLDSN